MSAIVASSYLVAHDVEAARGVRRHEQRCHRDASQRQPASPHGIPPRSDNVSATLFVIASSAPAAPRPTCVAGVGESFVIFGAFLLLLSVPLALLTRRVGRSGSLATPEPTVAD